MSSRKFSDLSCCPICGHDSFYELTEAHDIYSFSGKKIDYEEGKNTGKCYCNYCKTFLGSREKNKLSNAAARIVNKKQAGEKWQ